MELKLAYRANAVIINLGFNRTFMELKLTIDPVAVFPSSESFNRTFMELKLLVGCVER